MVLFHDQLRTLTSRLLLYCSTSSAYIFDISHSLLSLNQILQNLEFGAVYKLWPIKLLQDEADMYHECKAKFLFTAVRHGMYKSMWSVRHHMNAEGSVAD